MGVGWVVRSVGWVVMYGLMKLQHIGKVGWVVRSVGWVVRSVGGHIWPYDDNILCTGNYNI